MLTQPMPARSFDMGPGVILLLIILGSELHPHCTAPVHQPAFSPTAPLQKSGMSCGAVGCFSISPGCLSGAGMSFVCILRTEKAAWGKRDFSLSFASIQHILFFFSFSFPALINDFLMCWFLPEKRWGFLRFWQRGLWKRLKSWIGECQSERIKSLQFITFNYSTIVRNSVTVLVPYFCTRYRARETAAQQRAKGFASHSCSVSVCAVWAV